MSMLAGTTGLEQAALGVTGNGPFPYSPSFTIFSMALCEFVASAYAQKKNAVSANFIEFWNNFGTHRLGRL